MAIDWNSSDFVFLKQQLQNGKVILFTGAGFSVGAKNAADQMLPLGAKLAEILAELAGFSYTGEPLPVVYEAARGNTGIAKIWEELRRQFDVESYADWYQIVRAITWYRIYSLNIDNLFQKVYTLPDARAAGNRGASDTAFEYDRSGIDEPAPTKSAAAVLTVEYASIHTLPKPGDLQSIVDQRLRGGTARTFQSAVADSPTSVTFVRAPSRKPTPQSDPQVLASLQRSCESRSVSEQTFQQLREHVAMLDDLVDEFADGRTKTVSGNRKHKLLHQTLVGIEQCLQKLAKTYS